MSEEQLNRNLWLYLGDEEGYDLVHKVVEVDLEQDPKMPWVTTWSLPNQGDEEDLGWTWRGPANMFLRLFKSLGNIEESGA